MKKTNNKGFSLVELIIVVAIMAILIGVLAPQYIKYVEKSRISADENIADSLLTAVQSALADEDYESTLLGGETVVLSYQPAGTKGVVASATLKPAMEEYFGANYEDKRLKSKTYKDKGPYTITVTAAVAPKIGFQATGKWAK